MKPKKVYFVTGIDTDAGKSYATGYMAMELLKRGFRTVTQKFVQTGCQDISEDIELHRRLMQTELLPEDTDGTTCPVILSYPCSPHLASRLDGKSIDMAAIERSTRILSSRYDVVLIEGAGGIMVPLTDRYTTADYISEKSLPVILVTNPRLGSLNHTLLNLEYCRWRKIAVDAVAYNLYPETSSVITEDTREYLKQYLERHYPETYFFDVPFMETVK